ncbi:MAG: fibronectin type III domain-containing protein [Actinobacteria bacterium]|nr:fibronectin type III domain-containing protein [Actinomycetota bacterium]
MANKMKFRGASALTLIALLLTSTSLLPLQSASAAISASDLKYETDIDTFYNKGFVKAAESWTKATASASKKLGIKSAKYLTWQKAYIKVLNSFIATTTPILGLTGTDGFATSHPLLIKAITDYTAALKYEKNYFSKKTAVSKAQLKAIDGKYAISSNELSLWLTAYQADFDLVNILAPTTFPSIEFSASIDSSTSIISLSALLVDTSSFDQAKLHILSYDAEWYDGSLTVAPITSHLDIVDTSKPGSFSLTGVQAGGTYIIKVRANNAGGDGVWSDPISSTVTTK